MHQHTGTACPETKSERRWHSECCRSFYDSTVILRSIPMNMLNKFITPFCTALLGLTALSGIAQEPIKVGILHSLSGTMAISETSLKDIALMTIEEINKSGGVMGRKLEPVVVDPASNWPLFAEKARQLLTKDQVAAVFGCWTSVSRKSVLPVFEELNGLLFYPVQY